MRQGRDEMVAGLLAGWSETDIERLSKLLNRFNDAFETTLDDERADLETA